MSNEVCALINGVVFDGAHLHTDYAIVLRGDVIDSLIPTAEIVDKDIELIDLEGHFCVPGFIDLQVNGGGGAMFNTNPDPKTLAAITKAHRRFGTTSLLPTLITTDFSVMRQAIDAVEAAISEQMPGILGIHLEGPFLNAIKKGAHDADRFCKLDEVGIELVSSLKVGKTLLTLAPEFCDKETIQALKSNSLTICGGHSNANYGETRRALDAGLDGFTHLFNAMTPMESRSPGMVGAALEDRNSWFGIIADGYHVHPATIAVAIAAKQKGGALLVTDAMSTVGSDEQSFELDGETITVKDGRCINAAGSLAGSDLNMMTAVNNAADFAHIDWFEAVRMASLYPAQVIGLDHQLGAIKAGYCANLTIIDKDQRQVLGTWVSGKRYDDLGELVCRS